MSRARYALAAREERLALLHLDQARERARAAARCREQNRGWRITAE